MTNFYERSGNNVFLFLQAQPNAQMDEIVGLSPGPYGGQVLKVKIRALPEKGKANKAIYSLLAKSLGLPKSAFEVISGASSRVKKIHISGDPDVIEKKLKNLGLG